MSLQSLSRVGFGGSGANDALPKAIAELQGLTISLLTGAGAAEAIALAGIEAEDTILKALMFAAGVPSDITSQASIASRFASGTVTCLTTLVDGDTVTVNGKVYTFTEMVESITTNIAPQVVPITVTASGVDVAVVAARLAKVIMSSDSLVSAAAVAGVVTVTNRVVGTVGNARTLVTSSAHATVSGATLAGGTATNSVAFSGSTSGNLVVLFWYNKTP